MSFNSFGLLFAAVSLILLGGVLSWTDSAIIWRILNFVVLVVVSFIFEGVWRAEREEKRGR